MGGISSAIGDATGQGGKGGFGAPQQSGGQPQMGFGFNPNTDMPFTGQAGQTLSDGLNSAFGGLPGIMPLVNTAGQVANTAFGGLANGIQGNQPAPQPANGLNQTQQDYFKYANSQRAIEQQNEQANNARWAARQKAINDAGYGTGSAQYGHYDSIKDAAALKFMAEWDAANPYNNQAYDRNYADFNAYAQKNLGFNPNDPNNPNSVNGFANYDMGLREVRRPNNSMLDYINPTEGYQDAQGNYYDMSGKPMAPPSWASKTPSDGNFGGKSGGFGPAQPGGPQLIGGPAGKPIMNQPAPQPVNRFAPPNAPGVRQQPRTAPRAGVPVQSARTVQPNRFTRTRAPRTR